MTPLQPSDMLPRLSTLSPAHPSACCQPQRLCSPSPKPRTSRRLHSLYLWWSCRFSVTAAAAATPTAVAAAVAVTGVAVTGVVTSVPVVPVCRLNP